MTWIPIPSAIERASGDDLRSFGRDPSRSAPRELQIEPSNELKRRLPDLDHLSDAEPQRHVGCCSRSRNGLPLSDVGQNASSSPK